MIGIDLGVERVEQAVRLVRALGAHRYVAGRLHLIHALAVDSVPDDAGGCLAEARAWALDLVDGQRGIDVASRDALLWRRSSDAEVSALLDAFWTPGPRSMAARDGLARRLELHDLAGGRHAPFDESAEGDIHPIAVDAGWQLLSLAELDSERHKGAIAALGDDRAFERARLKEETAVPPQAHLYELPAIGPDELLAGADERGKLAQPFLVWAEGDDAYIDYVFRGIRRAAKLE